MNPKVEFFFHKAKKWQDEFEKLRSIALDCQLTEELKWGKPCYTMQDSNIVILQGFKEYCAIMFFKGALLKDPKGILVPPGKSQAARQVRFTELREIVELEPTLKAYIREAIGVEKAGLKVELKPTAEFPVPEEFQLALDAESPVESCL